MTRKPPYEEIDPSFLEPRDPILGYIKIGGKAEEVRFARSGKPWAPPVRYLEPARFEVTTREKKVQALQGRGKEKENTFKVDMGYVRDEEFHARIKQEKPARLPIRLLYPTPRENIICFLGAHSGSGWVCRGNGVEAKDVVRGDCVCPCPRLKQFSGTYDGDLPNDGVKYKEGETWKRDGVHPCRPRGQLMVILEEAEVFGGFWPFKTTSFESISNILKTLQILENMFGRVDGLPLEMRVMAVTKSYGEGQTTQPIVSIVLAAAMDTARQIASDAAAESRKFLPASSDADIEAYREAAIREMEEEGEEYAGEFNPEVMDPDGPIQGGELKADEPEGAEDDGPDYEVLDEDETLEPEPPESEEEEDEAEDEEEDPGELKAMEDTCRAVLKAAGWKAKTINDRVQYHLRQEGNFDKLTERLRHNMPKEWETVTGEAPEPSDELPE